MGFLSLDVTVMSRLFLIFSLVCSAVLLLAASAAWARSTGDAAVSVPTDFDLSRPGRARTGDSRFRIAASDTPRRFRSGPAGPQWSFSPIDGGPTLELAAFGAGRKGAPKLAHVRVDWNF